MEKKLSSSDGKRDIIELLNNKSELLERVLKITASFAETLNDQKAEDYIYLIDRRRNLFEDLASIDGKLSLVGFDKALSTDLEKDNDIIALNNKIKKTAEQIFKIDKSMSSAVDKMMMEVKGNLKNMTTNKNISNVYSNDSYQAISRFDSRK